MYVDTRYLCRIANINLISSDATIPGAQPYAGDTEATAFTIPCDSTVSLSMMFGGLTVPVEPTDLFTKVGDLCVGNVRGWKDTTHYTYIVGSAFIRNAYV